MKETNDLMNKVKQYKLVYDIQALPNAMGPDLLVKLADSGFVFYDSEKGQRPKFIQVGDQGDEVLPVLVDTKGKEVSLEDITKEWEDKEYWRKELYKCKHSPLHYFTNYLSISPKPTQQEVSEFLESIGMGAKTDSEEVTKEYIAEVRESFAETITLEKLQSLKPVRDRIDEEYMQETEELIAEAVKEFDLTGTNEKLIVEKLINTILKSTTKNCSDSLKYYVNEKTGRWDKPMFKITDKDVLVRLWKSL